MSLISETSPIWQFCCCLLIQKNIMWKLFNYFSSQPESQKPLHLVLSYFSILFSISVNYWKKSTTKKNYKYFVKLIISSGSRQLLSHSISTLTYTDSPRRRATHIQLSLTKREALACCCLVKDYLLPYSWAMSAVSKLIDFTISKCRRERYILKIEKITPSPPSALEKFSLTLCQKY